MKRITALLLALLCLVPLTPAVATPDPNISVLNEGEIPPTPAGMKHYLLVCLDKWVEDFGNSDGMVLLSLDETSGRVIITSLVRDMLVQRPNNRYGKLTGVTKDYGIEGLIETISRHFGIKIDKYILMGWKQVQTIVDAAGGVDLEVTNAEANYLRRYAISPTSTSPRMYRAGMYHFKGHAAVIYMRIRNVPALNGDTYDFGRTFRARYVLSTIAKSLSDISYEKARALLDAVSQNILKTNLSLYEMLETFNVAFTLRASPVEQFRLPVKGSYKPFTYGESKTQLVDFEINREALWEFLFENVFVVSE